MSALRGYAARDALRPLSNVAQMFAQAPALCASSRYIPERQL